MITPAIATQVSTIQLSHKVAPSIDFVLKIAQPQVSELILTANSQ